MSDSVRPHRRQPTRLLRPWGSPGKNTGVDCHFLLQCMKLKSESEVTQSYLTLCNPMDCSPPGSSVHGIFQARVLEWGAIAFSKGAWGQRNNSFLCTLAQGIFNSKNLWGSSYCYFILGVLIYCSRFLLFKFTHKPTVDNPQLSGMHITMYAHL